MINNSLIILSLLTSGLLLLLLNFWPNLDLAFSGVFYDAQQNIFIYKQNIIAKFFYLAVPLVTKIFIITLIIYLIYLAIKQQNIKLVPSMASYLLLAALIGPGFMVNSTLKNYHGRARPACVAEFGGAQTFSAALERARACQANCAFPSGHAAMAFYFSALAYTLKARYKFNVIYLLGLSFGVCVGWSRIATGGHFLSDVAAACFITLLSNHLIYLLWKKYA